MSVTAVPGVGVGDDEGPEIDRRAGFPLLVGHAAAQEVLVAVCRQEGADQAGRLVRHLAQRVAREIGAGILRRRALGGRRPAAEIDALDAEPLHHDGLTG